MAIKLVAEIGINHNGCLNKAKELIECAADSGFNYVKFQKRTPELCVPEKQKNIIRKTPWGDMKYIDYRKRLEFNETSYKVIDECCKINGIDWFASAWDICAAEFLYNIGCKIIKIPSAKIIDIELLEYCRENFDLVILSTGMSTEEEIKLAISKGKPNVVMHSVSMYPTETRYSCLNYILWLKDNYVMDEVGYSGHEEGIDVSVAAMACGATWIERHITLDKSDWGSDQSISIDPKEMKFLVKRIKEIEKALTGGYSPRVVLEGEKIKREQLRG